VKNFEMLRAHAKLISHFARALRKEETMEISIKKADPSQLKPKPTDDRWQMADEGLNR